MDEDDTDDEKCPLVEEGSRVSGSTDGLRGAKEENVGSRAFEPANDGVTIPVPSKAATKTVQRADGRRSRFTISKVTEDK